MVGLGAAQDGVDARHQLGVAEGLGDVIIAAHVEALDLVGLVHVAGQENGRDGNVGGLEGLEQREAGLVGQRDVEQEQVRKILLEEFQRVVGPVADLGLHAGAFKIDGDQFGELGLVFDHHYEGFGFCAHRQGITGLHWFVDSSR